jgi:serine phosphatase RsbU (regulator of sigma subunit)
VLDLNLRGREDVALCSVAMLVLPDAGREDSEVLVYLAGHPHPIFLRGDEAEPVGDPGPLLGMVEQPSWPPFAVALEPGDQLILYTDGVIEARRAGGERFGSERLRQGLAGCLAPDLAVERVRGALAAFGAGTREDDAALVAIRRTAPELPLGERVEPAAVRVSQPS